MYGTRACIYHRRWQLSRMHSLATSCKPSFLRVYFCFQVVPQEMAELYVTYERTPYFDRQSGMTLEVIFPR
jgi:hypothetical protein